MQQHTPGGSSAHLRPPGSPRSLAKSMKSSPTAAPGSPSRTFSKKSEKSLLLSQQNNHTSMAITTTPTPHPSASHSHSGSGIKAIFFIPIGVFLFVIWNMVQVLQPQPPSSMSLITHALSYPLLHHHISLHTLATLPSQHVYLPTYPSITHPPLLSLRSRSCHLPTHPTMHHLLLAVLVLTAIAAAAVSTTIHNPAAVVVVVLIAAVLSAAATLHLFVNVNGMKGVPCFSIYTPS